MAQITTGIRSVLSAPSVYEFMQRVMGAHRTRTMLTKDYIKPLKDMKILDIGCGPADILGYLPDVEYYGFDISKSYIESAKKRFGKRGHFFAKYLVPEDLKNFPQFDVVLMFGVLHHLDDELAQGILTMIRSALKPTGRLITIDPAFERGQNIVAKLLISKDRGQNVRSGEAYFSLAGKSFNSVRKTIRHQTFIPYTHCILECSKNDSI